MTVCVATMANNGGLFCAADRMLTRGSTQTEPNQAKIYNFHEIPNITIMWAGSPAIFAEAIQALLTEAKRAPDKYQTVQSVVRLYCDCFSELVANRAERAILTPLGLDRGALVSNKVSNDRARYLVEMVSSYGLLDDESVETIFAGHDAMGAHIYKTHNSANWCHDIEGFAAIGIGAEHADSQARFAGFTRFAMPPEALMVAYLAKRRAELAPGVGRVTDMCMRWAKVEGTGVIPYAALPTPWITALDQQTYTLFTKAERDALDGAIRDGASVIQQLTTPVTPPGNQDGNPPVAQPGLPAPTPDQPVQQPSPESDESHRSPE